MAFNNVYRGKKVLITGNTGFKELVVSMVTHAGSGGIRLFK